MRVGTDLESRGRNRETATRNMLANRIVPKPVETNSRLNSVALHLLDQVVLLNDLLRHNHMEILNEFSLVGHDALSRRLRLLEARNDVLGVFHLRRRGSEHSVRDIHSRRVNQRLSVEPELLALRITRDFLTHLLALLLEADKVAHVQINAVQNNLVVLLRGENHQLQGSLQGATRVHVELLGEIARSHDDARVARKTAADLVGIQNTARRLNQTPNLLLLIHTIHVYRLRVRSALLHNAIHLQNLDMNTTLGTHLFRTLNLREGNGVAARSGNKTKIVFSPRRFETVDAHANLAKSVATLSHLLVHHLPSLRL